MLLQNMRRFVLQKTVTKILTTAFFVVAAVLPHVCYAQQMDARISRDSWRIITKVEYREGIPKGLLHSMSLVETGMAQQGQVLPWPYTANVNTTAATAYKTRGEALSAIDDLRRLGFDKFTITADNLSRKYVSTNAAERFLNGIEADVFTVQGLSFSKRFQDKDNAVAFVKVLLDKGYTNVDVGLMQVNWKYHGENFTNLEDAFDPYKNVDYAVSYLRKHRQTRDWWGSVGRYHSGTRNHAEKYVKTVWAMYQKVHKLKI